MIDNQASERHLLDRLADGTISVAIMTDRAVKFAREAVPPSLVVGDSSTFCPVCLSALPPEYELVREDGFYACDYCVPILEKEIRG
ncbi:MAG: hypothetical protein U1E96_11925 [Azonexus sp.]